jgi:hypothetical protein
MAFRILIDRHHQERLAEAEESRLAATVARSSAASAAPRGSEVRARLGEWLVRAGESLGGEPVRRRA